MLVDINENGNLDHIKEEEHRLGTKTKIYKRRWAILLLFSLFSISNVMQYIQYSIIADVIVEYYGIEFSTVDWSAMIYMIFYVIFSFPGNYILDKFGLRKTVLIGIVGTCIGAWIKVLSVNPNLFWVALLGQGFVAFFQVFVLPIPPKLAATWFGDTEVSTACGVAVIGTQAGAAIGFLLPPLIVSSGDKETVENQLFLNLVVVAVFCTVLVPLIFFFFANAPPLPPSTAQEKLESGKSASFLKSVKNLLTNRSYVILLLIYGVNIGAFYPIFVLANQIILFYYPDAAGEVGILGLLVIFFGLLGSLTSGIILDKFKAFRATTFIAHALYLISVILFTVFLSKGLFLMYIILPLLGFFMVSVLSIGFELGVELTYPEPQGISGGLLTTSGQLFALIFTYIYSLIIEYFDIGWGNIFISLSIFVMDLLFIFVNFHLKRQDVQKY